jgi:NAD(P)-dependent dehydrogenase (short-subunit alcohol dehydrogenase family)
VKEEEGRLDILVNNAGYGDPWKPLMGSDIEDYWGAVAVNSKGVYIMLRSFLPLLAETYKKQNERAG